MHIAEPPNPFKSEEVDEKRDRPKDRNFPRRVTFPKLMTITAWVNHPLTIAIDISIRRAARAQLLLLLLDFNNQASAAR